LIYNNTRLHYTTGYLLQQQQQQQQQREKPVKVYARLICICATEYHISLSLSISACHVYNNNKKAKSMYTDPTLLTPVPNQICHKRNITQHIEASIYLSKIISRRELGLFINREKDA